ncbi:hypothetical protein HA402_013050 [Bradysia odoriphaga]|nr:hypothetical protein HA402_013050 [Bradysia odoriphaga]
MMHSGYDDETLKNDIALLEVETEFTFNKYVKPICLPDEKAVMPPGDDRQWLWGPYDTTCKIAGWGAITDRGPNRVDDQMEAYVPIVTTCDPNNTKLICAGYEEGGFDTCAGDSGGPFVCVNESNKNFIYLAGVTSGSYKVNGTESERYRCGTKGTYGTYTRTTHYILWIESIILKNVIPNDTDEIVFTKKCPGVLCLPSNRCAVRNGIPECLNAEDELDSSD